MFSLFLPPKIASAVQLYGDVTIFDDSASFLSLPDSGRLKSADRKSENKFLNDGFSIINILVTGRNSDGLPYGVICFHFF